MSYIVIDASTTTGRVFGIPLTKVIANDVDCKRKRLCMLERRDSNDVINDDRLRYVC